MRARLFCRFAAWRLRANRGATALAALALAALACNTLLGAPPTAASLPTPAAPTTAVSVPTIAPATPSPEPTAAIAACDFIPDTTFSRTSRVPAVGPTPAIRLPPLAPTLEAFPTSTAEAATQARHHRILQSLWEAVARDYVYADFNGRDWSAIGLTYCGRVHAGLSDDDFWLAMDAMLNELGDEHSGFRSPAEVAEEQAATEGHNDYVGIGVLHMPLPDKGTTVILAVFPGSPAEAAGLRPHDSLLSVQGEPLLDEDGQIRDAIWGPEGSTLSLVIQTPGEPPREVTLARRRIIGAIPVEYQMVQNEAGARIGYIVLPTFTDLTIPDQVRDALRVLSAGAGLDGLILDNRVNDGGLDTNLKAVLGLFTEGTVGHFISREEQRPLDIAAEDVAGSQALPLVVLVGTNTVSFGEIFAGVLQDVGRARLVGETTQGNVEILWPYDFEDGSRAWIARENFRPLNSSADWETTGIRPDVPAPAEWDEFTLANDPGVAAAVELLTGG